MSAKQVTPERIISAQASSVPRRHELGRDELALDRHHVAHQPDVQAQVVGQAAQQRHRRVGVRVDQAGHQHLAAAVDDLGRRKLCAQLRLGPDRHDVIVLTATAPGSYWVIVASMVRTRALVMSSVALFDMVMSLDVEKPAHLAT